MRAAAARGSDVSLFDKMSVYIPWHRWTSGWIDGWMDGWMDGLMDDKTLFF